MDARTAHMLREQHHCTYFSFASRSHTSSVTCTAVCHCVCAIYVSGPQDGSDNNVPAAPLVPTPQQQNGNLPAVPSTAGGPSTVPVQFVVPEYLTHWGQVLKVVGSLEELGSWKVEKVSGLDTQKGFTWLTHGWCKGCKGLHLSCIVAVFIPGQSLQCTCQHLCACAWSWNM
jgi:hypothetical protein